MVFLPVGSNRVPFSLTSQLAMDNVATRQRQLSRVANELATGRRINVPSDNPNEALRAAVLQQTTQLSQQFLVNLRQASNSLSFADGLLQTASDAVDSVKARTVSALDGSRPEAEIEAARIEIDAVIDALVSAANRKYLDRYVFSGGSPTTMPFQRDGNYILYAGDDAPLHSWQGVFEKLAASVSVNDSIGVYSQAGYGTDLSPNLDGATRLAVLNRAAGVAPGRIRVDAGVGEPVVVDLSTAARVQDVLDMINNDPVLSAQGVAVGLNSAGNGLAVLTGPGATVSISEVEGGSTARDLGLVLANAAIPADGGDLRPAVAATTPLALLNGGAGVDLSVPIRIANGPYSATIDLSSAATVEDVLNAINRAGVRVRAEINAQGTGINVLNALSGAGYSIVEASLSGTAARSLGVLTTRMDSPLSEFNEGAGVDVVRGADVELTVGDGSTFLIDLSAAKTVADVKAVLESETGGKVSVDLNPLGGLRLVDNTVGASDFAVRSVNGSGAARDLGIEASVPGGSEILGQNVYQPHVKGVFDTLLRIRDGLAARDRAKASVAAQNLAADENRLLQARGGLGGRLNAIDAFAQRLTRNIEQFSLELTTIVDADLSETAVKLALQQTALQAALASSGRLLQGSLLDFI